MEALFSHLPLLLQISAQGAILIVLVLAVQWICGGRLPPRWRYALWLLVLLRLALPWTIPSPVSLFGTLKLPDTMPVTDQNTVPAGISDGPVLNVEGAVTPGSLAGSSSGGHWLGRLWAAGALCLAICAGISHYRIYRRVARRRP